jgi:hypothetical protein
LKIDVEGHEKCVLLGADWSLLRPRVILVEAVRPVSHTQNHEEWEYLLLAEGYRFVLFDGLNRFYVREEDEEAASLLSCPANVLDDYIVINHLRALLTVQQLRTSLQNIQTESRQMAIEAEQLRRRGEHVASVVATITGTI